MRTLRTSYASTPVVPFDFQFKPGQPPYLQLVYAAKKAIVGGRLKAGDSFPSVRTLSQELRLNPNTVHKAVLSLVREGLLEVRPGVGTVVGSAPLNGSSLQKAEFLEVALEKLVVEAKRMGLHEADLLQAVKYHWKRL